MKNVLAIWLLLLPVLALPDPAPESLAFSNVTVIDATGAAAMAGMTVVVSGDRIAGIGKSGQVQVPDTATVIDATGKYLIPGLWDMHAHWSTPDYLPLFIVNGITGMRIMRGMPIHHEWRKKVEQGKTLGPRMIIASELVDGPNPVHPDSIVVANPAEARQAVTMIKGAGADLVKVYSLLPRDAYFALADEAKHQGIPLAGHVPRSVTSGEASDAGQKSISHLSGMIFATSSREAELPDDLADLREALAAGGNYLILLRRLEAKHAATPDGRKGNALYARFRRNGTWQCPTLMTLWTTTRFDDPSFIDDPRLKYLSPAMRSNWQPENHSVYRNATASDYTAIRQVLARQLEMVGNMNKAGVEFLACTDTPLPYIFPGFSLHEELALFVEAGLTPMEALQTATLNPARFLGREEDLGTIAVGKLADLVLLSANPLTDIRNTQKIDVVVVGGKPISKAELDTMLADVAANVSQPRAN